MQFNLIIVLFAFAALALDKLSLFDDTSGGYVNAPVDLPSSALELAKAPQLKALDAVSTEVASPVESNNADHVEQKMFPMMHQVVLGAVVVPTDY